MQQVPTASASAIENVPAHSSDGSGLVTPLYPRYEQLTGPITLDLVSRRPKVNPTHPTFPVQ